MKTDLLRVPAPSLFVSVEKACAMLAQANTVLEAKQVKDVAAAMRVWSRAQKDGGAAARQAAEITLRAERRMGQILVEAKRTGGRAKAGDRGGNRQTSQRTTSATLAELGVESRDAASRWQKIASLPESKFEAFVKQAADEAKELTTTAAIKLANGGAAYASSESVEWYTPTAYVDAAREVLGAIDLDPASSTKANEAVRAAKIYTEQIDGLSRLWGGRVWLNPPYAKDVTGLWTKKLADEHEAGRVTAAVLLVNAAPDREWFRDVWRAELVCFTNHRINFYRPGAPADQPVMGNAFAYWGPDPRSFARVFAGFGTVVRKA